MNFPQFSPYIYLHAVHERRKVNLVLVYRLDRFSRSLKELVSTLDTLREYGCDFVAYTERQFDTTTASGKLIFQVIGAISAFERGLISERTKLKLALLKQNGVKLGRPSHVDQTQILALRQQGRSLGQIATEVGYDRSTVCRVLQKGHAVAVGEIPVS